MSLDSTTPLVIPGAPSTGSRLRGSGTKAAGSLLTALISLGVILIGWMIFLRVFHVDPFSGRTPATVWKAVVTGPDAAANRTELIDASVTTLRDAFLGLAVGIVAGTLAAITFTLSKVVESSLMPMAMVVQAVPLIAITPLITLIFGRGLATVMIISGIVTFFPTLVNVTLAMKRVPTQSMDLMRAYGATPATTLKKAQFPAALPALFASLRIAAPLALIGALLAEWLATGNGLGYLMLKSGTTFNTDQLWAAAALITTFSVLLYGVISAVESSVLARFGPEPAR